jgi:hypothetical protein
MKEMGEYLSLIVSNQHIRRSGNSLTTTPQKIRTKAEVSQRLSNSQIMLFIFLNL